MVKVINDENDKKLLAHLLKSFKGSKSIEVSEMTDCYLKIGRSDLKDNLAKLIKVEFHEVVQKESLARIGKAIDELGGAKKESKDKPKSGDSEKKAEKGSSKPKGSKTK